MKTPPLRRRLCVPPPQRGRGPSRPAAASPAARSGRTALRCVAVPCGRITSTHFDDDGVFDRNPRCPTSASDASQILGFSAISDCYSCQSLNALTRGRSKNERTRRCYRRCALHLRVRPRCSVQRLAISPRSGMTKGSGCQKGLEPFSELERLSYFPQTRRKTQSDAALVKYLLLFFGAASWFSSANTAKPLHHSRVRVRVTLGCLANPSGPLAPGRKNLRPRVANGCLGLPRPLFAFRPPGVPGTTTSAPRASIGRSLTTQEVTNQFQGPTGPRGS